MLYRSTLKHLSIMAALVLFTAGLAACTGDDDGDDATDESDLRPITATPTGVVTLPEDILQVTVIIEDGEFDTQSIDAVVEQPVQLTFANRDDETYTLIVDPIIQENEIAAAAETDINFNAPNDGEFEGKLYDSAGEEITTIFINVSGPGGT